jgi:hypothetical protein
MKANPIKTKSSYIVHYCSSSLLCWLALGAWAAKVEVFTPDWSMAVDDYGYSDWAYDQRPGFQGREYLSGEWAAAIAYTNSSVPFGPTWLNPDFFYPDWQTGSGFYPESAIEELPGHNSYGFSVARAVIANGAVRIGITTEMIDTTNGVPQGLAPRSSGSGACVLSDRYVLRQSFAITNISGQPLSGVRFFKFLHSLQATSAVYDNRPYGSVSNGFHYTISQQGADFWEDSFSGLMAVHSDTVALHANRAPSGWEVGRYGIEGIDSHSLNKPSVGVHLSVEAGVLSGLDNFGPTNHWVSGALQFELGTLAPNASTNIDFLMSIGTVTVRKSLRVVAWGNNQSHQTDVPPTATNLLAVAAGANHSLALRADGRVIAWGDNTFGQATVPPWLSNVVQVAAGARHSLALRSDGTVVGWGDNSAGQLNVPSTTTPIRSIAAGGRHSLALLEGEDTIIAWGDNSCGQLNVPALPYWWVSAIAAGTNFSLALTWDGSIVGWGDNAFGQCNPPSSLWWPDQIAAGANHALAIDTTVAGWGDDSQGQIDVPFIQDAKAIAAGAGHSLALDGDGTVVAWGSNSHGQTKVPGGLPPVVAIAAGGTHSLALVPVPPSLSITCSNQQAALSWSAAWAPELENVVLEQAGAVPSSTWSPVDQAGIIDQGFYRVTLPLDSARKFFRLRLGQ